MALKSNLKVAESSNAKNKNKHVQFGQLSIQTYKYILGDHPAVTYGPPISMEWTPLPLEDGQQESATSTATEEIYTVEEYERIRPRRKATYTRPGHRGPQNLFLIISQVQREALLNRLEVDPKEIRAALREVNRIKRHRWASLKWYFHPTRTVGELPTNFYLVFRSCYLERKRKRFLRDYEHQEQTKRAAVLAA